MVWHLRFLNTSVDCAKWNVSSIIFQVLVWKKRDCGSCEAICAFQIQHRHFIPTPVDRSSASAWSYKHPWKSCPKITKAVYYAMAAHTFSAGIKYRHWRIVCNSNTWSPLANGERTKRPTLAAPALLPNMVTLLGSPLKFAMFSWTHFRAWIWSRRP